MNLNGNLGLKPVSDYSSSEETKTKKQARLRTILGTDYCLGILIWNLPITWFLLTLLLLIIATPIVHGLGLRVQGLWFVQAYLYGLPVVCAVLFTLKHWFRVNFVFMLGYWILAYLVAGQLFGTTQTSFYKAIKESCDAIDATERKRVTLELTDKASEKVQTVVSH